MKFNFSIRQKLVFGYSVMVISVLIISLYSILQLNRLDMLINTSLRVDSEILKASENLINALLVQMSHERKFIITGESAFKQLFEENAKEFNTTLDTLETLADSEEKVSLISTIKGSYQEYIELAHNEFMNSNLTNNETDNRRQQMIDYVSQKLRNLREIAQLSLNNNMVTSQKIGRRGAQVAIMITILTVVCGSVFAFIITRSIYNPLQRLKEVTHYISHGDFGKKIDITTEDEIGDLSNSFNIMCDRLQELDQLTSDFISNITHDLKTPIASITEANQLMLDGASGNVTPQQHHLLTIIKEDSARLLRLIDTIIDLSKMESGLLNYDISPVDISYPVIEAIGSIKLLAKRKNIMLSYCADKNLPQVLIDDDKMTQALINIFSNAIKFTPEGGKVSVEIKKSRALPDVAQKAVDDSDEAIKVSISDTGAGIEQEDLPLIFEKFYRGHTVTTQKGDGLGLAIVQHIVQAHRGNIWVESKKGLGSTFNILLPVKTKDNLQI